MSAERRPDLLAEVWGWVVSQVEQLRQLARTVVVRLGRGEDVRATCPVDDWAFTPRYTDGVCPLCGYRPPGLDGEALPAPVDWFWTAFGTMMVASMTMGVLVVVAYTRA